MKTVLQAGALADALDFISDALATSAHIPVLAGARLEASASGLTVSVTDFERYATATVAGAVVEHCGAAVLSATALTGIAEGFAKDATMTITADEKSASVQSGRSRYRPPVWPITDFPLPLAIDAPVCSATMGRHELRNLFGRTAFAASTEPTRSYLNGIYLHEAGGALTGVATDGRRLARSALPVRECAGRWPTAGIIVPNKAVAIINKLIKTAETIELIVGAPAGASEPVTLISIRAGGRTLTSRLISGTFPSYQTIIPSCSNNWAKIGRATLIAAANRAAAVSTERGLCLGITWSRGDTTVQMCLTREPDSAVDEIPAELHGSARTALSASLLVEQLDAISGENVRLDTGNHPGTPVVITDPADPSFVSLLMPMTWLAPALEPVRTRATRSWMDANQNPKTASHLQSNSAVTQLKGTRPMKISQFFKSRFLRADDIADGAEIEAVIAGVREETMRDGQRKPVLNLVDGRALRLNAINARAIADRLGDESDNWRGHTIVIFKSFADYPRPGTPCLRVRVP